MTTAAATTATIRSLDARVDDLEKEFREFMAEMRFVVTFLKWMGGFCAAAILAFVVFLLTISFSAGQLQQKVDTQVIVMGKLEDRMGKLEQKVDAQAIAVARLQEKIDAQTTAIQELKQVIQALAKRP